MPPGAEIVSGFRQRFGDLASDRGTHLRAGHVLFRASQYGGCTVQSRAKLTHARLRRKALFGQTLVGLEVASRLSPARLPPAPSTFRARLHPRCRADPRCNELSFLDDPRFHRATGFGTDRHACIRLGTPTNVQRRFPLFGLHSGDLNAKRIIGTRFFPLGDGFGIRVDLPAWMMSPVNIHPPMPARMASATRWEPRNFMVLKAFYSAATRGDAPCLTRWMGRKRTR